MSKKTKKESTDLKGFFVLDSQVASTALLCHLFSNQAAKNIASVSDNDIESRQGELLKRINLVSSAQDLLQTDSTYSKKITSIGIDPHTSNVQKTIDSLIDDLAKSSQAEINWGKSQKPLDLIIESLKYMRLIYFYLAYMSTEELSGVEGLTVSLIGTLLNNAKNDFNSVIMPRLSAYFTKD